jgi:NTE family protein
MRRALILPGAGARGAYQVGVLKAIARILPKRSSNPFPIIAGTSAGAINATVLASRAQNFAHAVRDMEAVWSNFSADQIFRTNSLSMLRSSLHWFVAIVFGGLGVGNPESLLDNEPLRELLKRLIPFSRIKSSIARGHLDALAITASAYTAARSVTFYQAGDQCKPWHRVRRIGRPEQIDVEHLMASAAVPFIFPPVRIGGEFYGDGSMRHRAPLSAAIHLGADRLLIIGVRDEHPDPEPQRNSDLQPPNLAYLAGYMLDTLFMDGVYSDLERLTRINQILDELRVAQLPSPHGTLRQIESLLLVPEEDIREIAARYAHELPRPLRVLLRGLGAMNAKGMQLVSYFLFESGFTRELIRLGYESGRRQEDHLLAFLSDQPIGILDAPGFLKTEIEH